MQKNSAILIIEKFSSNEFKQFVDFLNSPFHNKNKNVIRLFKILKKYHPDYPEDKISKRNIFREMQGNVNYKEVFVRNLFSDLNLLAEKFLIHTHISNDSLNEKFLISELYNRNIQNTLKKKISSFEKKTTTDKSKDQNYYSDRIFINNIKGLMLSDKTLTDKYNSEVLTANLKLSLITVMESSFQFVIEEQRIRIKHNYDYLHHSLEFIRNNLRDFSDSPVLSVYYNLWESFIDKSDEEYFLKARKIFEVNYSSFKLTDKKNMYAVMQAFCLKKINSGNLKYRKFHLKIMTEMLERKIISHREGLINLNLYRNVLITCFRENEPDVLKNFAEEYINSVSIENRDSILAYSNAHLNFLEGNFKTALELCHKINFNNLLNKTNDNLYFKNDVKVLTLMCMYESDLIESAICHIDTYKHFLNNSGIIKETSRKKFLNFINIVNRLLKQKIKFDDYNLFRIKKLVNNSNDLIGKDWIIEKIHEIEK